MTIEEALKIAVAEATETKLDQVYAATPIPAAKIRDIIHRVRELTGVNFVTFTLDPNGPATVEQFAPQLEASEVPEW